MRLTQPPTHPPTHTYTHFYTLTQARSYPTPHITQAPKLTLQNVKNLLPVAFMHAMAHITAVISLGAGAVSFTHIVKAAEPAFTALFSALFLKQFFAPVVYLSLVPVMGGVAIASLTERKFSWLAFNAAMLANTASAGRGIFAKKTMKEPQGQNMDAANLYAVLTIMATLIMAPFTLLVEGGKAKAAWDAALTVCSQRQLINYIVSSGLYFYLYNEVAFLALDSVHPVTHAVGNTIKRVVIIAASILVFKNPVTTQGYIGSAIAIAGGCGWGLRWFGVWVCGRGCVWVCGWSQSSVTISTSTAPSATITHTNPSNHAKSNPNEQHTPTHLTTRQIQFHSPIFPPHSRRHGLLNLRGEDQEEVTKKK
jgi:drug/metabolite transporter (DMT)-like permease